MKINWKQYKFARKNFWLKTYRVDLKGYMKLDMDSRSGVPIHPPIRRFIPSTLLIFEQRS